MVMIVRSKRKTSVTQKVESECLCECLLKHSCKVFLLYAMKASTSFFHTSFMTTKQTTSRL